MEMLEILEKSGLSKNESKVYIALLDLGLTTAKAIIDQTHLHRQIVYDNLRLLIDKGLASFVIQSNKKYFKASDPKEFLNYFEEQKEKIHEQKSNFEKILGDLQKQKEKTMENQEALIYSGNKGIKSLLDDMLNQKNEILTIGASDVLAKSFNYHLQFNLPKFHKLRESKKINYKILLSEEMKERANELSKLKHTEVRVLPKEFTSNSSANIYGDKVSLILWGSQPFGVLIKSREIAVSQKKHFYLLWRIAKKPKVRSSEFYKHI